MTGPAGNGRGPAAGREPRFVVRSVTGFTVSNAVAKDAKEGTIWYVLDSLDCYRIVYEPAKTASTAHFLCDREAKRLNADHEDRMASA